MFYIYNETFGSVARREELTGKIANRCWIDVGPTWNNQAPPRAYASDDIKDFYAQVSKYGCQWAGKIAHALEEKGLIGTFTTDDEGDLVEINA
jgi:hypothetical protein